MNEKMKKKQNEDKIKPVIKLHKICMYCFFSSDEHFFSSKSFIIHYKEENIIMYDSQFSKTKAD